jgi:hypothetical protein
MKISQIVPNISTLVDKKRIASQYVIDYRNLVESALDAAILKTAPQYYNTDNVKIALTELLFHSDRDLRVLHQIILKTILLNQDDFLIEQKKLDDKVIDIEQEIINISNEEIQIRDAEKNRNIELFKFVLEAAWDRNDDISPDEKNLIEKIKKKLKVSDEEYQIIEAKLGKFPKPKNEIHLRDEIKKCRNSLQNYGLLFCFRTEDRVDYDIIPEEIASTLREIWEIEIKKHGYHELLKSKYVRGKQYLMDMLDKTETVYDKYSTVDELQELIISHVPPTILLGGISPRDGLDASDLTEWCRKLSLSTSGQKNDLIKRIIEYYDEIKESVGIDKPGADERDILFTYYAELAERKLDLLRKQGIISKDIECEKHFEKATYYIFEKFLGHKPLQLTGTITIASRLIRLLSWSLLIRLIGGQTPRQLRLRAQAVVKWIPGLCLVDFVFVSSGSVVSFDGNYFPL